MTTKWMVFRDWLRAQFWHKISAVSVPNMPELQVVKNGDPANHIQN